MRASIPGSAAGTAAAEAHPVQGISFFPAGREWPVSANRTAQVSWATGDQLLLISVHRYFFIFQIIKVGVRPRC